MLLGFLQHLASRVAAAAVLVACLLAWASAGTARADSAQVTVVSPGGAQQTLSLEALAGQEDVRDRPYALRSARGESTQTVTGFSLAAILTAAGVDTYGFSYLEAQRPAGGSVLLSRHQALDPGAFAEGTPVVYATATGTGFLRPSSGPEDLNATDAFEAPQGVTLVLRRDSPLQVRAKASTQRTKAGQKVTFNAIVEGAGSGEQLAYSWYFDDGHSASGANATHSFAERGSYDVVVGVTTPGDEAGVSAVVTVQVGAPLAGPDRKGGGTDKDAKAPDHGAATGTPGAGSSSPTPESPPAQPAGSSSHLCSDSETKCELSDAERRRRAREAPEGKQVSGLLLTTDAVPVEPVSSPAARTGKLDEGAGGDGGLPDAALGLLVTGALLGFGALTETRNLLR
ncbi:MAG TPA: PKD domain-containing protein [Solirubrobacterales bacterium]|nr:PKD domain-containing protein [Solirubrobacterales bacterium]